MSQPITMNLTLNEHSVGMILRALAYAGIMTRKGAAIPASLVSLRVETLPRLTDAIISQDNGTGNFRLPAGDVGALVLLLNAYRKGIKEFIDALGDLPRSVHPMEVRYAAVGTLMDSMMGMQS